jgi:hypothetical protein
VRIEVSVRRRFRVGHVGWMGAPSVSFVSQPSEHQWGELIDGWMALCALEPMGVTHRSARTAPPRPLRRPTLPTEGEVFGSRWKLGHCLWYCTSGNRCVGRKKEARGRRLGIVCYGCAVLVVRSDGRVVRRKPDSSVAREFQNGRKSSRSSVTCSPILLSPPSRNPGQNPPSYVPSRNQKHYKTSGILNSMGTKRGE